MRGGFAKLEYVIPNLLVQYINLKRKSDLTCELAVTTSCSYVPYRDPNGIVLISLELMESTSDTRNGDELLNFEQCAWPS